MDCALSFFVCKNGKIIWQIVMFKDDVSREVSIKNDRIVEGPT
jgi:hypothetical protein